MRNLRSLLDSLQTEWPVHASLLLTGYSHPPIWAIDSAQRLLARLEWHERVACQSHLPRMAQRLTILYRDWIVATVLALLLAMAVMAQALSITPQGIQHAVLVSVLFAILLPPLVICNGIARDYVAVQALLLAARSANYHAASGD